MLGFHKRVAVPGRGGDVGVPHQFLLHAYGARCRPATTLGVTERVPAHIAQFAPLGKLPPFCMNGDGVAIVSVQRLPIAVPHDGHENQTPAGRTKAVLLRRERMEAAAGDRAGKDQL